VQGTLQQLLSCTTTEPLGAEGEAWQGLLGAAKLLKNKCPAKMFCTNKPVKQSIDLRQT